MDDLNYCLSQIIHLCIETNLFLNQLYKFECQFTKFSSSYPIPLRKYFLILEHFSIIINDLNLYYKNYFSKTYSNIIHYLLRKYLTINYSNNILDDFYEDLNHLNYFLNHQNKYYRHVFYYLHKISITCILCIQYRQICTNFELTNRFIYIRIDLFTNLKKLHEEIQFLLIEINSKFQEKKQISIKTTNRYKKEKIRISNFYRTISLWLILIFFIGYYFVWSND